MINNKEAQKALLITNYSLFIDRLRRAVPQAFRMPCRQDVGGPRGSDARPPVTCNLSPVTSRLRRAGFTMVELLVVLAIMVIVAAISIPAFAALFAGNNMVQAQNQLSAAVAGARTLAIQNHTDVALIFFEEPGHTGESAYAYEQASPGQSGSPSATTYFQPGASICSGSCRIMELKIARWPSPSKTMARSGAAWLAAELAIAVLFG